MKLQKTDLPCLEHLQAYKDLDSKLQGLQDGDLIIIAARPSMGKTALSMNIVENLVLNKDIPGGVWCSVLRCQPSH